MAAGNLIRYTVIYSYLCSCGALNNGTVQIDAANERAAVEQARKMQYSCYKCGNSGVRKDLRPSVQLLAF